MSDSETCYVVGSGPAGISCAQALVAAGKNVTILDSGLTLETDRQASVARLAGSPVSGWTEADLAVLRGGVTAGTSGIPLKLAYGSDYPYREVPGATAIQYEGPHTKPSYSRGGLSTVWGSAILPYRQSDIPDWPISIADLEPAYRAVLSWMPMSGRHDALATLLPLYRDNSSSLPMSRQAAGLLDKLENNRSSLNEEGVFFGKSRLAVRAEDANSKPLCVQCGLCMYGCPHSLIYSTDHTLAVMLASGRLKYQSGVTVQSVAENGNKVVLRTTDQYGEAGEFQADRVFLGAGLLNTTAILLRSLQLYNTEVVIKDSQYFLLPLLRLRGTAGVVREPLHTLAQLFLEIFDNSVSPYTVHLQTYTYNELFREPILAKLGPLKKIFPIEAFLGRLLLFQGYLHSANSIPISATLERQGTSDVLKLKSWPDPEPKKRVKKLSSKLLKLASKTGVVPLLPLLQMGDPGRGFHSGGSFPMSLSPSTLETDIFGRPNGFRRVHAVDSTVLPSIPATTVTFSVMANAYRIGAACWN